jgi:hypothetical protein
MVFTHPHAEPWRTIGVFLKIAGKSPETALGRFYDRYGHARHQRQEARRFGELIGRALQEGISLDLVNFRTRAAIGR